MFDNSITNTKHHEDTVTYEDKFRRDRSALIRAFRNFANPFQVSESELLNIVSKEILSGEAAISVTNAKSIGEEQAQRFKIE